VTKTSNSKPKLTIYEEVAGFTHDYFGVEAAHYIARLIEIHIRKSPELLSREELMSLLDWIKGAASFFADDKERIEKYISQLFKLASDLENSVDKNAT
jgi:hypothetical protein